MYSCIYEQMKSKGYDMRIVSIDCLEILREETESLYNSNRLENEISDFLKSFYRFTKPDSFEARSILVVASPSPQVKVHFNYQGKKVPVILPPTYREFIEKPKEIELYLKDILQKGDYHIERAANLPEKLLAVHSGLSNYGRNNISYIPGMGSFLLLSAYFTDLPCEENSWQETGVMKACESCTRCMDTCPTGAITARRYLIHAKRCITWQNEFNTNDTFPEWIDPASHNSLIGCLKCQLVCPQNSQLLSHIVVAEEFSEEETQIILQRLKIESLPLTLTEKLDRLNLRVYYQVLARNLKVLLELAAVQEKRR